MEMHRPLGLAGRTRGEPDQRHIVLAGLNGLETDRLLQREPVELGVVVGRAVETHHGLQRLVGFGAAGQLVHQARVTQRVGDFGLVDVFGEFGRAQHRHGVDDDGADLGRGKPASHHGGVVGRADQHTVAGLHLEVVDEGVGELVGPVGELLVGAPAAVADQGGVVAEPFLDHRVGELVADIQLVRIVEPVEHEIGPLALRREVVAGKRVYMCGFFQHAFNLAFLLTPFVHPNCMVIRFYHIRMRILSLWCLPAASFSGVSALCPAATTSIHKHQGQRHPYSSPHPRCRSGDSTNRTSRWAFQRRMFP